MNTNYLLNNLFFLQSVALKYINLNELGSQFDKNDLVNHGFLKFHEADFNSESHFFGVILQVYEIDLHDLQAARTKEN
jgi:hypothetical protein